MPFFGINLRSTAGYVTDGTDQTYLLQEAYPTVRGSVTFGYDSTANVQVRDRDNTLDPRLAGVHFINGTSVSRDIRIDLDDLNGSGSYDISLASGDADGARPDISTEVLDNATSVHTVTGSTDATNLFLDAQGTAYSPANWPGSETPQTESFSSTICFIRRDNALTGGIAGTVLAHIGFTWSAGGSTLLVVQDANVGIPADSPALIEKATLAVADSTVSQTFDNVDLVQANVLAAQDAGVSITSDAVALVEAAVLAVNDASVSVAFDNVGLNISTLLSVADSLVSVTADNLGLTPAHTLAVQDVGVSISLDNVGLVGAFLLAVDDALVAITADGVVLVLPSAAPAGKYASEHARAVAVLGAARDLASTHARALNTLDRKGI